MTKTSATTDYDRIDLVLTKNDELTVHRYIWSDWMDSSWRDERKSWRRLLVDAMPLRLLAEQIDGLIESNDEFRAILEINPVFEFTARSATYFEPAEREALTSQPTVPLPSTLMDGIKAELRARMNAGPEDDDDFADMGYAQDGQVLILACASIGYTPALRIHVTPDGTHEAQLFNSSAGWQALEARGPIDPTNDEESVRVAMALWDAAQQ